MKISDYCNKVVKITFNDNTVKFHQFTDRRDFDAFNRIVILFDDVRFIDVYDHVNTRLMRYERKATIGRATFPMEHSVSIRKKGK